MKLRQSILRLISPVLLWIGRLHWPFQLRRVDESEVWQALSVMKPGDVLLTKLRGAPTNLLIPGRFKHAAIYSPGDQRPIIEAVGDGTRAVGVFDFLMSKDSFIILRSAQATTMEATDAGNAARDFIGLPYDTEFLLNDDSPEAGNKAMYCAELVYAAYRLGCPGLRFKPREIAGRLTIAPQDFLDAKDHWRVVWCSDNIAMSLKRSLNCETQA